MSTFVALALQLLAEGGLDLLLGTGGAAAPGGSDCKVLMWVLQCAQYFASFDAR